MDLYYITKHNNAVCMYMNNYMVNVYNLLKYESIKFYSEEKTLI